MDIRVTIEGDLVRYLNNLGRAARPAAKAAIGPWLQAVAVAAKPLTPVDEKAELQPGALRDSVRASKPRSTRRGVTGSVLAGGPPLEGKLLAGGHKLNVYAQVQHEDPTLRHDQGQANYIGQPFFGKVHEVPERLADEIERREKSA